MIYSFEIVIVVDFIGDLLIQNFDCNQSDNALSLV